MNSFLLGVAAFAIAGAAGLTTASFVPAAPSKPLASSTVLVDMGMTITLDKENKPHLASGHGSGVNIGEGLVLTAAHVADDKDFHEPLSIVDTLGKRHAAKVLWANHEYDVALLQMADDKTVASDHLSCRFLDRGEKLSFSGNPYNLLDITTYGQVANPTISDLGLWAAGNTVNAAIDPGMSGGPAFDRHHNVVGINVGTIPSSGLGFIVPGHVLCKLLGR
jgi:serine protease Do